MAVSPSHVIATIKSRGGTATATLQAQVAAARKKAAEKAKEREAKKAAAAAEGKKSKLVAVETGLFADRRVEVTGSEIAEGDKVVVAE